MIAWKVAKKTAVQTKNLDGGFLLPFSRPQKAETGIPEKWVPAEAPKCAYTGAYKGLLYGGCYMAAYIRGLYTGAYIGAI